MDTKDIKRLTEAAKTAIENPNRCQRIVINGFRFDIYWRKVMRSGPMEFEVVMFYVPGWGHCRHFYPSDIDSLVLNVKQAIADGHKNWPEGGKFVER